MVYGDGISQYNSYVNPDTIVVGGGVSKAEGLLNALQKQTEELVLDAYRGSCRIAKADLR